MAEIGVDISKKRTQSTFDVLKSGQLFSSVITVCDESSAERCPIFPGPGQRLHWSLSDPSTVAGNEEEKLRQVRKIRDEIRCKVEEWCEKFCPHAFAPNETEASGCVEGRLLAETRVLASSARREHSQGGAAQAMP
jgi:hypothetical protein